MSAEDLTDLQRGAIAATSAALERLLDGIEAFVPSRPRMTVGPASANGSGDEPNGAAPPDPVRLLELRVALARMIELYGGLFQQTFEAYAELAQSAVEQVPAMGSGAGDGRDAVPLAGPPAGVTATQVWLHNVTAEHAGEVELRMTSLTAHDGSTVDARYGSFAPRWLRAGAGVSCSSRLTVAIPPTAVPGEYHGHVLAGGLPGTSLVVRLTVEHPRT